MAPKRGMRGGGGQSLPPIFTWRLQPKKKTMKVQKNLDILTKRKVDFTNFLFICQKSFSQLLIFIENSQKNHLPPPREGPPHLCLHRGSSVLNAALLTVVGWAWLILIQCISEGRCFMERKKHRICNCTKTVANFTWSRTSNGHHLHHRLPDECSRFVYFYFC